VVERSLQNSIMISELPHCAFYPNIPRVQGCQMACFQTKNPSLGKFLTDLHWKILVYVFMAIWSILRPFGIFY
jgi:hypothetical protein